MITFKAVGYHGTNDADSIIKNGIKVEIPEKDVFLGRGFYIWRDSYKSAKNWRNSKEVNRSKYRMSK